MRCPEHIEDLLPDYHLDQLGAGESAEVRRALETSPECRERLDEIASVLDRLPLSLAHEDPPPSLKDRVLAQALGDDLEDDLDRQQQEPAQPMDLLRRRTRGWRAVVPYAGGVAAALAILAFGLSYLDLREENRLLREEVGSLESTAREESEPSGQAPSAPQGGELLAVAVEGTARAAEGRGTAVVDPDSGGLALDVYGLPDAPRGHAYHAWLVGADGTIRHLGEMELEGGDGRMTGQAPDPLSTYSTLEVTTEPMDGTGEKLGPVYLRAEI